MCSLLALNKEPKQTKRSSLLTRSAVDKLKMAPCEPELS